MIIKKLKLNNIRSYSSQEIEFPKGSILLSGDIGSGKTTILLGIEFALFGLQPGLVKGSNLLRHGADKGSVELEFELQERIIRIKRGLERKKDSVGQTKGSIVIDGREEEFGPEELKARILNLLGYPKDLLKKANMLYRFTIYTPQEEMKQILMEGADERLNTLRLVFDIEKYKNVISNAELIAARIREMVRAREAMTSDIDRKRDELKLKVQEMEQEQMQLNQLMPEYEEASKMLVEKKGEMEKVAEMMKGFNKIKEARASSQAELMTCRLQISDLSMQISSAEKEIERTGKEISMEKIAELEKISSSLIEIKKTEEAARQKISALEKEIAALDNEKRTAKQLSGRISSLEHCPTCEQHVGEEHKKKILGDAEIRVKSIEKLIEGKDSALKDLNAELEKIKIDKEKIRQNERVLLELKSRQLIIEEKKRVLSKQTGYKQTLESKTLVLEEKVHDLDSRIKDLLNIESRYDQITKEIEDARARERSVAMKRVQYESRLKNFESQMLLIKKEIIGREEIISEAILLKQKASWIAEHFSVLIAKVEKSIMLALNVEFNKMFGKWFSMLVDDVSARVDESFNPIIEQQGYELEYGSLSGGERTAAALAYRLALNQIINGLMSKLATKSIVILDEPTDGFSSEQLDKMRELMQELRAEQIMLVSHESKIEGFVQNIIRFSKQANLTSVRA